MMRYVRFAFFFLCCAVAVWAQQPTMGPRSDGSAAAIHGRVRVENTPAVGAHVIVVNSDATAFFGESVTSIATGPDAGSYQVTNLPSEQELHVFAFHERIPGFVAHEKIVLARGEYRRLPISIDLNHTDPGFIEEFIVRIPVLLEQAQRTESSERLIRHLKSLRSKKGTNSERETGFRETFEDGDFTTSPSWSSLVPVTEVVSFGGNKCLDMHYVPMADHSPQIVVRIPARNDMTLEFDVMRRDPSTPENNVRVGISRSFPDPEQNSGFSVMENDRSNVRLMWNSNEQGRANIRSFDARWQHVVMRRRSGGEWSVVWDQGGSNEISLAGRDYYDDLTDAYLWIRCDGYYNNTQGAYFDNFVIR